MRKPKNKKDCEVCGKHIDEHWGSRPRTRFCSHGCARKRYAELVNCGSCSSCHKENDRFPVYTTCSRCREKCHRSYAKRKEVLSKAPRITEKECNECHVTLPAVMFSQNICCSDGLSRNCKKCNLTIIRCRVKKCKICSLTLPVEDFHRRSNVPGGRNSTCVACHSAKQVGTTGDVYRKLSAEQSGMCAICGVSASSDGRRLALDHCHETGVVRGLLCARCNHLLGHAGDSVVLLQKAVKYLQDTGTAKDSEPDGAR